MKTRVGLIGFGVIGTGVVELIHRHGRMLHQRTGIELELTRIADLDIERPRPVSVSRELLTSRWRDVVEDPSLDVVVELVGGTTVAHEIVTTALRNGKHVVTANKALLCEQGESLFQLAKECQRDIRFEASVAGGIPIIRVLTESLAGDRVTAMYGIVNGTTNFILARMIEEQWTFSDALVRAQQLGFAEADPTLDVSGGDAMHKLAILATIAFDTHVEKDAIHTEGIQALDLRDVLYAKQLGYVVKLLAIAKAADGSLGLRVHPTLIPEKCSLASVKNEFNAVMLRSEFLGDSLYVGRGAGAHPTASAVVGDLLEVGTTLLRKSEFDGLRYVPFNRHPLLPISEVHSRFYLRLQTDERAGILAVITRILGEHDISISSIVQQEVTPDRPIPIVILTHLAKEKDVREAIRLIDELDFTQGSTVVLHVEDIAL